jgi:hypothetical protein
MPILSRLSHRWNSDGLHVSGDLEDEIGSADFVREFSPVFHPYEGVPYVFFPEGVGDHLTAASVAIAPVTFMDVQVRLQRDWSNNTRQVIGWRHDPAPNLAFFIEINNTPASTFRFFWTENGTDTVGDHDSEAHGLTGVSTQSVRVLLTYANPTNYTLQFFLRASDGDAWVQLGATINGASPTTGPYTGAGISRFSGFASDQLPMVSVRLYYARIIDATGLIFNLEAGREGAIVTEAGQPMKIEEEVEGTLYTVFNADSIPGPGSCQYVDRPCWQFNNARLDGGDNADYPDGGPMLVYAIVRLLKGFTDEQIAICKAASAQAATGWALFIDSGEQPAFRVTGAVSVLTSASTPLAIGEKVVLIGYRHGDNQVLRVHETAVASSTTPLGGSAGQSTDLSMGAGNGSTVDEARHMQVIECGIMFDVATLKDLANLPYELGLSPVPAIPDVGRSSTSLGIQIGL